MIQIQVNMTTLATVSVTQFYIVRFPSNALHAYHQQVTHGLPQIIRYDNDRKELPPIAILKIYQELSDAKYFILYIQPSSKLININSTPKECPHVLDIFSQGNIFL